MQHMHTNQRFVVRCSLHLLQSTMIVQRRSQIRPESLRCKCRVSHSLHILSLAAWVLALQIVHSRASQLSTDFEDAANFTEDGQRNGRTFFGDTFGFLRPSIFNIVRFPNEECLDASNQSGTCYTALECKKLGGNPSSKCARGLGTCCIMSRSCHNTTTNKVVYFRNPSFPLTDSDQTFCDLTVNIVDSDVCQLRIDFMEFQIDQPVQGDCIGDKFTVTASGMTPTSVPVLCGNNRNQHIYVTLPVNKQERSVSIVFETNSAGDYRWHLRVTQIDCRVRQPSVDSNVSVNTVSPLASNGLQRESRTIYQKIPNQLTFPAPTGCLQYFTNPTGTIESFNFGHYLNNLDYAICIDRQADTCRIIYTSSDANFGIEAGVPSTMPGVGDVQCNADYLLLSGGSQTGESTTKDRYCGGVLSYSENVFTSQPVISKANGPLVIRFHTDNVHHTTLKEGFRVKYEQSPTDCTVINAASTQLFNANLLNSAGGIPGALALQYQSGRHPEIPVPKLPTMNPIDEPTDNILKYTAPAPPPAVTEQHVQTRTVRSRSNHKVLVF